jgi:hypothetical protein
MCEMFVIHRTSSIVFLLFSARGNHKRKIILEISYFSSILFLAK